MFDSDYQHNNQMLNMLLFSALIFFVASVDFVVGKPNFIIMLMDDVSYKPFAFVNGLTKVRC